VCQLCCTGPGVEAIGNRIELFLAVEGQDRSLWQVLPQQAVGIFAGAPLLETMRVEEVDPHAGIGIQVGMACHFLALVIGQALAQRRTDGIELGRKARQRRGGSGIFHTGLFVAPAGTLHGCSSGADAGCIAVLLSPGVHDCIPAVPNRLVRQLPSPCPSYRQSPAAHSTA
jgi:hypothetical protein